MSSGHTLGSSARPTSEFMASGLRNESKTPEAQQIDQWFKNLANFEETLEEMAAASTDQNFNEELGAIEQCELFLCGKVHLELTVIQGSEYFPRPRELPPCTPFSSTPPRCRSDSS